MGGAELKKLRENQDLERGGVKFDTGKLRYDLVSPLALDQLVAVLTYGANKYRDRNWEVGMPWGRAFAAAMRHLWAWWRGETLDKETGLNHLAHAMCNVMFLLEWAVRHPELDDRPYGELWKEHAGSQDRPPV
jgi:hypothetical protein